MMKIVATPFSPSRIFPQLSEREHFYWKLYLNAQIA